MWRWRKCTNRQQRKSELGGTNDITQILFNGITFRLLLNIYIVGDKMISVIRMDDTFIQLLKDKKEITISNLIFCYETLETLGSCLTIYNGDKTNQQSFYLRVAGISYNQTYHMEWLMQICLLNTTQYSTHRNNRCII